MRGLRSIAPPAGVQSGGDNARPGELRPGVLRPSPWEREDPPSAPSTTEYQRADADMMPLTHMGEQCRTHRYAQSQKQSLLQYSVATVLKYSPAIDDAILCLGVPSVVDPDCIDGADATRRVGWLDVCSKVSWVWCIDSGEAIELYRLYHTLSTHHTPSMTAQSSL